MRFVCFWHEQVLHDGRWVYKGNMQGYLEARVLKTARDTTLAKIIETTFAATKTKAETAVETVFDGMKKALSQGDRIELRGFGVFTVRPRKTGIGRNPRTGAEVSIPPGKAVRFKPGKELQSID